MFVDFRPSIRIEFDFALHDYCKGFLGKRFHPYKPLIGKIRFDHRIAPVAVSYTMDVILRFVE